MFALSRSCLPLIRRIQQACFSTFQEGDFCLLREVRTNRQYLVGPLEPGAKRDVKGGMIYHNDLIGRSVRSVIRNHKDKNPLMLHAPTLEDYILNVPRNCTPIYPKDASAIVQLLDIEPGHRILEAGTGNGSLTLYLARAVSLQGQVHTYDIRQSHSMLARKHVQRYERGRYKDVVSFHLGSVADLTPPEVPFDGIALDMPDPRPVLPKLLPALRNDRFVVCYLPNMTQVLALLAATRELPLMMETCIEAEWKEWEVRATQIRDKSTVSEGASDEAWVCRPKNYDVRGHTAFLVKLRKCAPAAKTSDQQEEPPNSQEE